MVMKQEELEAPGVCFLCETAMPQLEYFDTGFQANMDWDYMGGTKYVCQSCFDRQAEFWGYVASNQIELAEQAIVKAKAEVTDLYNTLQESLGNVSATWQAVENIPVSTKGKPDVSKETKRGLSSY